MDAPLSIQASSLDNLKQEIIQSFDLDPMSALMLAYCGKKLTELPRDGATIFASVILKNSKSRPPKVDVNSAEQKSKLQDALKLFHQHMKNPRILLREKIRNVIESNLIKRYEKYPVICENDQSGARLAENMDLFFSTFAGGKKVYQDHPIIQVLMVDIFEDLKNVVQAQPPTLGNFGGTSFVPFGGPVAAPSGVRPMNSNPSRAVNSPITSDMLSRALSAAAGQTSPANDQAASNAAQVAALAQAVESGIAQLREMGILAQTTEENARRILRETGGNVEATINRLLGG